MQSMLSINSYYWEEQIGALILNVLTLNSLMMPVLANYFCHYRRKTRPMDVLGCTLLIVWRLMPLSKST